GTCVPRGRRSRTAEGCDGYWWPGTPVRRDRRSWRRSRSTRPGSRCARAGRFRRAARVEPAGALPPNGRVDALALFDRLRPQAGRHVLVATVGDDEDDVPLVQLARDPGGDRRDCARRDAREDPLLEEQLPCPVDAVPVRNEDL